jgi:hypothetical protein
LVKWVNFCPSNRAIPLASAGLVRRKREPHVPAGVLCDLVDVASTEPVGFPEHLELFAIVPTDPAADAVGLGHAEPEVAMAVLEQRSGAAIRHSRGRRQHPFEHASCGIELKDDAFVERSDPKLLLAIEEQIPAQWVVLELAAVETIEDLRRRPDEALLVLEDVEDEVSVEAIRRGVDAPTALLGARYGADPKSSDGQGKNESASESSARLPRTVSRHRVQP